MKKESIIGIGLIMAMLLAACSATGGGAVQTQGAAPGGVTGTEPAGGAAATMPSGGAATEAGGTGAGGTATESTGTGAATAVGTEVMGGVTETVVGTELSSSGGLSGTAPAGTALATPMVGGTPAAGGVSGTAVSTQSSAAGTGTPAVPVTGMTSQTMLRVTEVLTYSVVDSAGTAIGTVEDLVIDARSANTSTGTSGSATGTPEATGTAASPDSSERSIRQANGSIAFVVVSRSSGTTETAVPSGTATSSGSTGGTGSTMTGGDLVPIPWEMISVDPANQELMVNMTAAQLGNAPSFSATEWPDLFSAAWRLQIRSFWGSETGSETPEPMTTSTP